MSLFSRQPSGLDALLRRPRPGAWQQFLDRPCVFLARMLYTRRPVIPARPLADPVSVVCISDTHNCQVALPDGDILVHAGDLTQSGSLKELQATVDWLRAQPHPIKIVVAGNHDVLLDPSYAASGRVSSEAKGDLDWGDLIYLEDAATTVTCPNGRRLRVYGSPRSPRHGNWAFQYLRSDDVWAGTVPAGVDILITHCPPRGHLDLQRLGCVHLLRALWHARPRLHVFGHVHEGAGTEWLQFDGLQDAYERTVVAGGGLWKLALTTWEFLKALVRPATEAKCLLVNPSIVGGLRDDEHRRPIRVVI